VKEFDHKIPVVVLNCKLTGLAIMRSLGRLGIPVYGVDFSTRSAGMMSRYCKERFVRTLDETKPGEYLDFVMSLGARLGEQAILIPTSDELAVFVAEHQEELGSRFLFSRNDPNLIRDLISKKGMYHLANQHRFPTPTTLFPESLDEVLEYSRNVVFPLMLKGIHGNRLSLRTGKKMVIAETPEALIEHYKELEDFESPNLMIQEYIPGGDDSIFVFNGYFNAESECLAAFTGHKIRQYPIHVGCASLGICTWNREVSELTKTFMKAIGYRGILDIGYRYDARDRSYKVLDINPRIGQAFRLFLGTDGTDVVRMLYTDLTGRKLPVPVPREGRRWMIEDYDIESSIDYFREGTLSWREYIRSLKGLEECAWFDWRDPYPFLRMCGDLAKKALSKVGGARSNPVHVAVKSKGGAG
jgi:D-aspartate ligase